MALLAAETKRDDLIKSLSGQAADQVSFDADLRQYRKRLEEQTAQLATLGDQLAEEERRKQALEKDLAAVSASLAAEQSLRADAEVQLRYVDGSVGACACACRHTMLIRRAPPRVACCPASIPIRPAGRPGKRWPI